MNNELSGIADRFSGKKILVIGDLMLDEYIYGTVERVSPEAPVCVVKKEFVYYFPGGAANTANNITALGGDVILIGVVGYDEKAERLLKVTKDLGIKTDYFITDKSRPTTIKTRIIANRQQVVRIDTESVNDISDEIEEKILETLKNMIPTVNAIILSDYAKGTLTERLCREAIRLCKENNKKIIVDPKADFSKYQGATIITPNEKEFKEYSRITGNHDVSDVLKIIENIGLEAMMLTKGKEGLMLYEKNGKTFDVPAINQGHEVVDITGAGDTVMAVFALALSSGASMEQAAKLSNYGAGIVVKKLGTATTTIDELKKELEKLKE